MEKIKTAIVGGGAAGLVCATRLHNQNNEVILLERLDRVGKKLSATGNGQGNISNEQVENTAYLSFDEKGAQRVSAILSRFGKDSFIGYMESLGGLCLSDERGRIYPASRQASSVTDLLRKEVEANGVDVRLGAQVKAIQKSGDGFILTYEVGGEERKLFAKNVLLCTGGKAAKNFGTDGNGYALAKRLGHTVTSLYPSLVQLKTDTKWTKTLKGIRAQDCSVKVLVDGKQTLTLSGDVIFTEYGVSGDAIFRLSAYIADKIDREKVSLLLDFAPQLSKECLQAFLEKKKDKDELLCGVVNNQIGRAIVRRAKEEGQAVAKVVKGFELPVTGSLGFDYAQVTKGGVCLDEVDENLQSKKAKGLYLAGEILDVDGPCGGFNLQWAYSSACVVAEAINQR